MEEHKVISSKISSLRETLIKLGKSLKAEDASSDILPEFCGFQPPKPAEAASVVPEEADRPPFLTQESSVVIARSRGNSAKNLADDRTVHDSELYARNNREVDILLQRIAEKDRLLREQTQRLVLQQEEMERLKSCLDVSKGELKSEIKLLEQEVEREKRQRVQAETQLKSATVAEETKLQHKIKASFSANEQTWQSDLRLLQGRLEEVNKVKLTLMSEKAELTKSLQMKDFEVLKLRESVRELEEGIERDSERHRKQFSEFSSTQREVSKLRRENDELRRLAGKASPKPVEATEANKDRIAELEALVEQLKTDNGNLRLELSSRPTQKQIREKEQRIEELLESSKATKRASLPQHRKSFSAVRRSDRGSKSPPALQIPSPSAATPRQSSQSSAQQLISRLSNLVQDCAPTHAYPKPPTHREIWTWVRRIAEEFVALTKSMDTQKENSELILETVEMLGLSFPTELPKGVSKVLEENEALRKLAERVKTKLGLNPRASIEELTKHLSSAAF